MAASSTKRVTVLRFDREPLPGYASAGALWQPSGVEVLSATGTVHTVPAADVKAICFVRSWEEPTGLESRREFVSRPKLDGLWVRFDFRDGDFLEALIANHLTDWANGGVYANPPDSAANTQRLFVPASALNDCRVVGVIGAAKRSRKPKSTGDSQLRMFE